MPLKATLTPYFSSRSLNHSKMADVQIFRWVQNLNQWTWYHEILYADVSSKDERHLLRPFLWRKKHEVQTWKVVEI
jgi:hypothetical protein